MVYPLSLTPASGVIYLPQIVGTSYPDGTLIAVEQGVSVPKTTDLEFSVTITNPPVPATNATWGQLKSTYR